MADHAESQAHPRFADLFDHPMVRELIDSLVWVVQGLEATYGALFGDTFVDLLLAELTAALRGRGSTAGQRRAGPPGRRLTST